MTHRHVELTLDELALWGKDVEKKLVERLRRHGIPVRGMFHFKGVKHGILRARSVGDRRLFDWWDSESHARSDGVYFGDQNMMRYREMGGQL